MQGEQAALTGQPGDPGAEHGGHPTAATSSPAARTSTGRLLSNAQPSHEALAPRAVKVSPNPSVNSPAATIARRGPDRPGSPLT